MQTQLAAGDGGAEAALDGELLAGLPALPQDRGASQLVETLIQGKASLERSSAASENGPALLLDASAGGFQWALYGFSPAPDANLDSVQALLDVPDGSHYWLALADYSAGRWKLYGPYSDSKTLLVDDPAYRSPGGNLYVVALVEDGQSVTVNALSVRTINPANSAPTAAVLPDVLSGDAPLAVSFDASESADSDGTIIEYAWDWDNDGGYDSISDAPLLSHIFTSPGIYDVKLRVTDEYFARDTETVTINVTAVGNNPPNAVLGGGLTGTAPLTVLLDAGLSDSGGDAGDSIVKFEWDYNNDQVYEEQGALATVQHVYTQPGTFKARVRVTDSAGNQDVSNFVSCTVNEPPQAQLEINPGSAQQGAAVDLFGGLSSDSDTGIVKYEWDTDGNGSYDTDSGFDNKVTVSFDLPGVYLLSLRVTDGAGAVDTASGTLAVHGWTSPVYPDPATAGTGNESSLAVVGGLPAIAYYEAVNTDLFYIRALDAKGLAWNSPVRVNSVQSDATGRWPSMKLVGGNPAVAFHDSGNGDLMYCRSSDNFGTVWPASTAVDSAGDTGQYASMQIVDGLPHIAYHQQEDLQLRYVRASDSLGSAWDASFILDNSGDVGAFCSLAVINGNPAVSYWDDGAGAVMYMRSSTSGGTSWGSPAFVNGVGSLNSPVVLLQVNGNPAVGHEDNSSGEQWLSRSSDAQGMSWPAASELPPANASPASFSMTMIDGNPAIAFFDNTGFDLKYSRALNKSGTQWEAPQTVDTSGVVGGFSSMVEVNGGVGISYYDSSFSKLKYVWGY